jgi:outer membrane protein assembly factor BamE (lipoprotein component of BamABCDE complex)
MKSSLLVLAALTASLAWIAPALAEPARPAAKSGFAQTERNAVDLKQGMSSDEVQKLLGKPRRTALKSNGSADAASQGTLQWTYAWTDSSQGTLRVEFAAKAPAEWRVTGWEWATY